MPHKAQYIQDDEPNQPTKDKMNMDKYLDRNYSENFMKSLPDKIKERVQVLLKYHDDYTKLQEKLEQQEQQLRKEFDAKYAPIFERRKEIINGTGPEVTDEEVMKGFPKEHTGKVDITKEAGEEGKRKPLPEFWLGVLHHNVTLSSMITKRDEGALKHLIDVSSHTIDGGYGSFEVVFTFAPNDYFQETQLTISLVVDDKDSTVKRGPLTWKKNKNLTMEPCKPKPGNRSRGAHAKSIPCESFFNIFQTVEDDDFENEEVVVNVLRILHNNVIPCAVLHYTDEADIGDTDVYTEDEDTESDDDNSDSK